MGEARDEDNKETASSFRGHYDAHSLSPLVTQGHIPLCYLAWLMSQPLGRGIFMTDIIRHVLRNKVQLAANEAHGQHGDSMGDSKGKTTPRGLKRARASLAAFSASFG